ncbi:kinase, partial [Liquorilactobacillus satsumensis]
MRNHILILLAGANGTGKSYTSKIIKKAFPRLNLIPLDLFKEHIYDEIGFDNVAQKNLLDEIARQRFYDAIKMLMNLNKPLLGDYPFSYKQRPCLVELVKKYDYNVLTIRLEAKECVLYERQKLRDLDHSRHLGHLVSHYHLGDRRDESALDNLPSFEYFSKRIHERGYETFHLGTLITLNVNDYRKIDYND